MKLNDLKKAVVFTSWCNGHPVDQGLLIIEALRSHSDTPHSVGLLWTSDQPIAETSTWQHTTFRRDRHPYPRRDSNPQTHALDHADNGIGQKV